MTVRVAFALPLMIASRLAGSVRRIAIARSRTSLAASVTNVDHESLPSKVRPVLPSEDTVCEPRVCWMMAPFLRTPIAASTA